MAWASGVKNFTTGLKSRAARWARPLASSCSRCALVRFFMVVSASETRWIPSRRLRDALDGTGRRRILGTRCASGNGAISGDSGSEGKVTLLAERGCAKPCTAELRRRSNYSRFTTGQGTRGMDGDEITKADACGSVAEPPESDDGFSGIPGKRGPC